MKKIFNIIVICFFLFLPIKVFAYQNDQVTLYFFHGDGCSHCAEEMNYLKKIENKYENFKIVKYEVWYNDENAELLKKVNDVFSIKRAGVPTNIIGDTVISGFDDTIGNKIERAIVFYKENEYTDIVEKIKNGESDIVVTDEFSSSDLKNDADMMINVPFFGKVNFKNVSLVSASVIIGLVDGFNPCAMWILLFLISILIGMKDRKRVWLLGLTFLFTSGLVYLLIILAWIKIAFKITSIIWIRNIIAIFAIIGGLINIINFIKHFKDNGCSVVDEKKRKKIFSKIRKFTGEKSLMLALLGAVGLAVSVNLVELACSTALPVIFSELLIINHVNNFMKLIYTLIYILFFLADDLIVFFIAMFTMKVTGLSSKYNKYSHLFGGLIMFLIGSLLLFKPKWLMFNFR